MHVLARPRTQVVLDWEVRDLLKTAARQAAGFLAQMHATEALLEARKFDADVKVRCRDIGPVSAKSSVGLASLQARKGDTLRFSATGPEAEQAVEALALFVSSGFGE